MSNVAAQYCLLSKSWNTYNIRTKTKPVCIPVYIGLGRYRTSSSLPSRTFYLLIYGVYLMVEVWKRRFAFFWVRFPEFSYDLDGYPNPAPSQRVFLQKLHYICWCSSFSVIETQHGFRVGQEFNPPGGPFLPWRATTLTTMSSGIVL